MSSTENISSRRRGPALEQALLDAAWDELNAVGYKQLTFDNVALRAGTSKPVLYRRWPNRLELVRAALRAHQPVFSGAVPNTGSLRGDVLTLLEDMAHAISGPRQDIIWGMAADAINDERQYALLSSEIAQINQTTMRAILEHAEARGELTVTGLSDRIITLPIDLLRHEMLMTGGPASKAAIKQIVDDIFLPLLAKR